MQSVISKKILAIPLIVGLMMWQALVPSMAHATTIQSVPTKVYVSGHLLSSSNHIVAIDPWSGKNTSYLSMSALQLTLRNVRIQSQWDGTNLTLTAPSGWKVSAAGAPQPRPVYANEMGFVLGGGQFGIAPKLIVNGVTYAPIYYINQILTRRFFMGAMWHRSSWTLTPQKTS